MASNRESKGTLINQDLVSRVAGMTRQKTTWFSAEKPLPPSAPSSAEGRRFDYPTGYNIAIQPRAYEPLSFGTLRNLADGYDLMRLAIETRKDQLESYEFEIIGTKKNPASEKELYAIQKFFEYPDNEHPWPQWLRAVLEDMLVLDAVSIYLRRARGGQLFALELVDPATIKRVLDDTGRTPIAPDPAFQQVLKGIPATNYTTDEMFYFARNYRTNKVYGFSPVEQVIMTVNIALRRQLHQLNYFTEGNVPEALAGVPDTWSLDQIQKFQKYWDTLIEGDLAAKRHLKFIPLDATKVSFTKQPELKDLFDEWLARIICFCFSLPPTALVKETNRSTSEQTADTAKEEGTMPWLNFLQITMTQIIKRHIGVEGAEFRWVQRQSTKPRDQAEVDKIYIDAGVYDENEVRARMGMKELTEEEQQERRARRMPPALQDANMPGQKVGQAKPGPDQSVTPIPTESKGEVK